MGKILKSSPSIDTLLLEYLARRFTYFSYQEWCDHLKEGRIRLNQSTIYKDTRINSFDLVEFELPEGEGEEPPVESDYSIVFEDEWILVVDKPGDLPVHPAGRYKENTLLSILEKKSVGNKLFTIHRLDRETSGLIVFAKDERSAKLISKEFQKKNVLKLYLVWVWGDFPDFFHARGSLFVDRQSIIRKKRKFISEPSHNSSLNLQNRPEEYQEDSEKKEFSETIFKKIGSAKGKSLVFAEPRTGRTHQIRATLYSLGFPVVGDKIYGVRESAFLDFIQYGMTKELQEELGHKRQALHSFYLEFTHPHSKEKVHFISPFPFIG